MKPQTKLTILLLATVLLNIGCAEEKQAAPQSTVNPPVTDCSRGCSGSLADVPGGNANGSNGNGTYYSGATASLTGVSTSTLGKMFFNSKPNSPTQIQVNIDVTRTEDSVIISYVDGGKYKEAGLGVTHPQGGRINSRYNGWVNQNGTPVYKGFYQDQYGAIILIVDKTLSLGDGQPAQYIGGQIWFQNFGDTPGFDSIYQGSATVGKLCWEITYGPYDCRSWVKSTSDFENAVDMVMQLLPTAPNLGYDSAKRMAYQTRTKSYVKLGEFNGLSRSAAGL